MLRVSRFLPLLAAEQEQEEAVVRERLATWSVRRLQQEGYCIAGMRAFWMEQTRFGRPVASFSLGPGMPLPPNGKFESGTQVLVTHLDPLTEAPQRGSVLSCTATQLRVSFQKLFDLDEDDRSWRLDVGRTDISFDRMRAAIAHFAHDPALQERSRPSPDRELILHGTRLRDVLLRGFIPESPSARTPEEEFMASEGAHAVAAPHRPHALQDAEDTAYVARERLDHPSHLWENDGAFQEDMRVMSWARRYMREHPVRVEGDPALEGLNATQVRAVAMMIGQRASLVQGPPGTGKTKTIIETVKLLKTYFDVPAPLLVCTYTNVAVDNLVEGFAAAGLTPLRVSSSGRSKRSLYAHTLEAHLERHPRRGALEKKTKEAEAAGARVKSLSALIAKEAPGGEGRKQRAENMRQARANAERRLGALNGAVWRMKQEMLGDVLRTADVVCATSVTSANAALRMIDFPVVFLDEASMSTEPASLIPLMKGSRHVALIGDHKQLPPVITSQKAREEGLGISLFERLTEEGVVPSIMLDIQYRMHPDIARFPSSEFYGFSLRDGMVDAAGNVPEGLAPPVSEHLVEDGRGRTPSVVFLDHAGPESVSGRSRINWTDAHIVCSVVEDLLASNPGLKGADIGVIAPYAAQVTLLTRLLTTDGRYGARFRGTLGERRAMELGAVEVKSVDGFEGREKAVVVFSTVRNNEGGQIGFLADRRRLNVGLTRAKRGLFVVGSLRTLGEGRTSERRERRETPAGAGTRGGRKGSAWTRYVDFVTERGMVVPVHGTRLKELMTRRPAPPPVGAEPLGL
ncbi:P-loop containing nucleoside triphosphate hydrolase protein [Amylostereum chailletii]|nr:P-loop containing nucleoside triphosphate hydrolase protein [Amylostereum chailletii]